MNSSTPTMSGSQRQEFCVRWNSHLGSIGAAFPQLLAGQRFVDVTLACEGHQVHCHRLVLAACSSYFESILAENPCKHPVIILPSEIKLWEIQALVDFMYKGEVNVTQAGLPQLLRCAEQLRIRGLYGSDAALNLNQLKVLTNKPVATAVTGNLGELGIAGGGAANDSIETDDTGTNSTTTTTAATAASALQQMQGSGGGIGLEHHHQYLVKKEPHTHQLQHQPNGEGNTINNNNSNTRSPQNHRHLHPLRMQLKQEMLLQHQSQTSNNSNVPTDESAEEDSTSNAFDQYENFSQIRAAAVPAASPAGQTPTHMHTHLDSTFEEDHNYVAAHDDDSFGADEHDTTGQLMDTSASFKRVRRSEASLAQAAKCVSKGQTFQTVSNMFNIPVSTIRFYMARKGILPKRKRGRGASSSSTVTSTSVTSAIMAQALAQMKRSGSPTLDNEPPFHLVSASGDVADATSVVNASVGYKRNDTLHMI